MSADTSVSLSTSCSVKLYYGETAVVCVLLTQRVVWRERRQFEVGQYGGGQRTSSLCLWSNNRRPPLSGRCREEEIQFIDTFALNNPKH